MTILACGDRNWTDQDQIESVLGLCRAIFGECFLIHGGCWGADAIAGNGALILEMPTLIVPARWSKYGNSAGPKRNLEMLKYGPDVVLAFHDDIEHSRGTKHMVGLARSAGLPFMVIKADTPLDEVEKFLREQV